MEKVSKVKKEYQIQSWQEQISQQKASGLTVKMWCDQNGIKKQAYYYRLRKVRESLLSTIEREPKIVPVKIGTKGVPIQISVGKANAEISEGTSSELIANVLKAMNEIC